VSNVFSTGKSLTDVTFKPVAPQKWAETPAANYTVKGESDEEDKLEEEVKEKVTSVNEKKFQSQV